MKPVELAPELQREWERQERALHAEKLGVAPGSSTSGDPYYRAIAHALRKPLDRGLDAGFAGEVATRAQSIAPSPSTRPGILEDALLYGVCTLMAAALVIVLWRLGIGIWLNVGSAWLGFLVEPWAVAASACMVCWWILFRVCQRGFSIGGEPQADANR